ncbi:hypothetical protein, partial [Catellatospora sp. NPDC049609]|uniref:hypothetical protein n=1 Tax=Catellatospora sp. NPDC049609 TaxID=3155505 RepID=UPI003418CE88
QLYDSPSSGAADHLVYSAAIPVTPGEDITVAAATEAFVVTGTTTLSLYVGWFTRSDQTWEQAASTSLLWSDFDTFPFVPDLGGTVVVPEGAAYARVAIRNQSTAAGYISVIAGVEAHR